MAVYLVGSRLTPVVAVLNATSGAALAPGTFAFRLVAPPGSGINVGTYSWNGTVWTSSEATIALPAYTATGVFRLRITVPYLNSAAGQWWLGWKHTANGNGEGEGSGELRIVVTATGALA